MSLPEMRHLDLCSGIGGFALAARWMGWKTVGFAEIDEFASRVLEKHWPGVPNYGDIATIPDGIRADLITAGIPCQPWSLAGKRLGYEDDRAIWPLAFEVIRRVQPRYVVLENVVGFIGLALDGVLSDLEKEGYETGTVVLPACAVNAPHRRDRVWIVAHAGRLDSDGRGGERGGPKAAGTRDWTARSGEHADDVADAGCLDGNGRADLRAGDGISNRSDCGREETQRFDFGGGEIVAHPVIRPDQQSESRPSERALSGRDEKGDGDVSDSESYGVEESEGQNRKQDRRGKQSGGMDAIGNRAITDSDSQSPGRTTESRRQCGGGQLKPCVGRDFARLPAELDRPDGSGPEFWDGDWERGIPRVATGIKDRAKRLKSLGNSIVPQLAYQIFRAIEDSRS